MPRGEPKKSAKAIVYEISGELRRRNACPEVDHKLALIEEIARRMGWRDLALKLKQNEPRPAWWID